jgi:hypothetical protein
VNPGLLFGVFAVNAAGNLVHLALVLGYVATKAPDDDFVPAG